MVTHSKSKLLRSSGLQKERDLGVHVGVLVLGEHLAEDIHGKLLHLVARKLFYELHLRWLSQSRNIQVVVDQISEIAVREISLLHSFEDCDYTLERS